MTNSEKTQQSLYQSISVRRNTAERLKKVMLTKPRGVSLSDYLDKLIEENE